MTESVDSYMKKNGVQLSQKLNRIKNKELNNEKIINHFYVLDEFHTKIIGYKPSVKDKFLDNRGYLYREFKNKLNLFYFYSSKLKKDAISNEFEDLIYFYKDKIISQSEKAFTESNYKSFMNILKRSCSSKEICLGDTGMSNIWRENEIYVRSFDKCSYDLYENDALYLLLKLKNKGLDLDWDILIDNYCTIKKLNKYSYKLMCDMICFPYHSIKATLKYFRNEYDESYDKIQSKFLRKINTEL